MFASARSTPPTVNSTAHRRTTTVSGATHETTTRYSSISGQRTDVGRRPAFCICPFLETDMKHAHLVLALLGAGLIAGCANPSRSRDLANPNVPAQVLAQQVCSN